MSAALGILLYPGAALLALLTFGLVRSERPAAALRARGVVLPLALVALLLALLALLLLPWPLHPLPALPLLSWLAAEGAAALIGLAALLRGGPAAQRAAVRGVQIGFSGRAVVFAALLSLPNSSAPLALVGALLALVGAALALPAALERGPFGPELSLGSAGAEAGLAAPEAALLRVCRALPGAVAAGAWGCAVAALLPAGTVAAAVAVVLALGATLLPLLLRDLPRLTTLRALRWCWWRALPLVALGAVIATLAVTSGVN